MVTGQDLDTLIGSLEQAVEAGLAYFAGPGQQSGIRIDLWEPREVLCHMIYWHQATLDGMESVTGGGEPYTIHASTDEMNARAVGRAAGKGIAQLIDDARDLQQRLVVAARAMPDLGAMVLVRGDGREASGSDRLETIPKHWNEHIEELKG